jgi:hypothetical protein
MFTTSGSEWTGRREGAGIKYRRRGKQVGKEKKVE